MSITLDGREVSVEAVAEWLEGLPEDFMFNDDALHYGCCCLVGRYVNQEQPRLYWVYTYSIGLTAEKTERLVWLRSDVRELIDLFDTLSNSIEITAGELRRRLVAYIFWGMR